MKAAFLALILVIVSISTASAGIDETYQRPGSLSWGQDVAAKIGVSGFGRSIAVVIGVGAYTNGWAPLEAPPRDAEKVRDFLRDHASFDIIYTITDSEATRERIRQLMLNELPSVIGPQDRVLFYFSGHGTQRELYGGKVEGYLALARSAPFDYASMIEMSDVRRWWAGIAQAKQSLFILDACFSGLGLQLKNSMRERTISELSRRGHHIVTAGTADQDSYASLSRWGGSLFTTAMLDGMQGRADSSSIDAPADGIVSLKELWDYVGKRVRAELPEKIMTPQLASFEFSNEGEFFFVNTLDDNKKFLENAEGSKFEIKGNFLPSMPIENQTIYTPVLRCYGNHLKTELKNKVTETFDKILDSAIGFGPISDKSNTVTSNEMVDLLSSSFSKMNVFSVIYDNNLNYSGEKNWADFIFTGNIAELSIAVENPILIKGFSVKNIRISMNMNIIDPYDGEISHNDSGPNTLNVSSDVYFIKRGNLYYRIISKDRINIDNIFRIGDPKRYVIQEIIDFASIDLISKLTSVEWKERCASSIGDVDGLIRIVDLPI